MRYYLISLFIILTLVLSSSLSTFVTGAGDVNVAYATTRGDSSDDSKSSDNGGGDDTKKDKKSSKDSSSGSSGEESSSPPATTGNTDKKNNDNKDINNSPSTTAPDNTAAGGDQNKDQAPELPDIPCIAGICPPKVSLPPLPPPIEDECKKIPDLPYCKTPAPTGGSTTNNNINKNIIKGTQPQPLSSGGSSSSTAGTSTQTSSSSTSTGINFLTYVNAVNKITIKYPSTWTKTESLGDSRIPVMFNAPMTDSTAASASGAAAKTSFMIIINKLNPPTLTLDSYTQQQIDGLTHSKTVKYTITGTNAKVLTPPNGASEYREINYDGLKSNNVIATAAGGSGSSSQLLIPLKGTAIFFVNGDTGYSLLYLAKQTDYDTSLPVIQQMINSFQIGASGVSSSTSSSGGGVQSVVSSSSSQK